MNTTERHNSVYTYIGQRIRERRKAVGMSQTELSVLMGFSYQQIQKYENGSSQISIDKLLLFAKILNVTPHYFYEGIKLDEQNSNGIKNNLIQKVRTEPLQILLIEDNPSDVILFKLALSNCTEPTEVHIIHQSETVMDFLQNHKTKYGKPLPNIIILALALPKISGMQLLKFIKKNPKTLELPVIILTSSISVKDMIEAYRLGASGFIQKSTDAESYIKSMDIFVKYWSKVVILPVS